MRYISLSRRNSLFCGSHQGAKRAALIYSLACSCRLNNINSFEYFKDLLTKLIDIKPNTDHETIRNILPQKSQRSHRGDDYITIMGKSDNMLYINILSNVRCVLKLIQNRLKRLVFSWRQATFLVKTTWKVSSDPGGRAWESRVWRRGRPGSTWNRNGDVELFICLVWGDFMHCFWL